MMENRSFDHLLGYLKTINPAVDGLTGSEYKNYPDPTTQQGQAVPVSDNAGFAMPFDPPHEFLDVQKQLYGPGLTDTVAKPSANPRVSPAPMNGFLYCGNQVATANKIPAEGGRVMQCFAAGQVPCIMTLAQQFALFNFWYSSLPGPTWPNRFFVHAATSGGLSDSPSTTAIMGGIPSKTAPSTTP